MSSATSLSLSLIVGRTLGASGLGIAFAGFSAYVMLLALHRALVTTPLISTSSHLNEAERIKSTRTAVGVTLSVALLCSSLMFCVGSVMGGPVGNGLRVFAPWLLPAFAQELFRSSLFRDGRGRQAAATDIAWFCTLAIAAPFAVQVDAVWAIVAAWGLGGTVAALMGGTWMRAKPMPLSIARTWFLRVAFPFGRWLAVQEVATLVGTYALIITLTMILGPEGVGGMRAADSVFGLFTLIAPALLLAGLPATSRALSRSRRNAVVLAMAISGAGVLITLLYAGLMLIAGARILTTLYGMDFTPYTSLVVPIAACQIAMAVGVGFGILVQAERRGQASLAIGVIAVTTSLIASSGLAVSAGVHGAVWGLAIGQLVGTCLLVYVSARGPRGRRRDATLSRVHAARGEETKLRRVPSHPKASQ